MNYKEKVIALLNSQELSKEQKEKLENIFPELKENEDERIRKGIIDFIKYESNYYGIKTWCHGYTTEEIIAWLEKQGANKEYIFRPVAGTMIENAIEQALKQGKQCDVVLAFNGFYTSVKGKTSDEILTEYDHWLEKQGKQKQPWKPTAAQLIVIKDLIEDKNTSKVNKVILRGMFDEFNQFTNSQSSQFSSEHLLDPDKVIEWLKHCNLSDCDIRTSIIPDSSPTSKPHLVRWLSDDFINKFKKDFEL